MHISKEHRKKIYECLFTDGVLVGHRSTSAPDHMYIEGVSNLKVLHLMRSLKSKKMITEKYSWNHHYWTLTDTGIEFLRSQLKLPGNCIPATLKRPERPSRNEQSPKKGDAESAPQPVAVQE
ncbi:40S ribosomal protein S10-2 [Thelohanellus kitauei]|uniref:40S ribosomal protein S10-2 n=1 Tax=Thelohanellus kitauei TaxID=669202 RepID=A0A0C2IJ51_THEKT|nr:40S ribosomal protein S10-2 [Thelohanellus kitauei]